MYNQSALPFDPVNLDPQPGIRGTFHMPSRMPQQFNPNMRDLFPMIDGQVKAIVDGKAEQNCLRAFLYNQLSRNDFNNPEYAQLVCMVADATELYFATRQFGTDPGNVVANAADNLVTIAASANVFEFPELANYIEPALQSSAQRNLNVFNTLKAEIANFQGQAGGQPQYTTSSYQGNRPAQGQHYGGGNSSNMYSAPATRQVHRPSSAVQGNRAVKVSSGSGYFQANDHGGQSLNNEVGRRRGGIHEFETEDEVFEQPAKVVRSTHVATAQQENTPASIQQKVKLTGPVIMDEVPDGVTVKPGTLTNILYNKHTQRKLYIITPTNRYVEVIVEIGDNMDYKDHELDAAQVTQTLPARRVKAPEVAETKVWNNYQFDGETLAINPTMQGESTSIQVHSTIDAHSEEEAELILRQSLQKQGVTVSDGSILEYHYRHLKPISFAKGYDGEQVLLNCETLEEFVYELPRANIPKRIIGILSNRAVNIINEVLNHCLSIPWKISELSDYDELIASLEAEQGKRAYDLFKSKSVELVPLMFNALPSDEAADYLSKCYPMDKVEGSIMEIRDGVTADTYAIERVDSEEGTDFQPVEDFESVFEVIVMYDTVSVTLLPWNITDMGMSSSQVEGVITESVNPTEFETLTELFKRTEDTHVRHYYIDTQDGKRLSVHRGWLNKNYFKVVVVK